MTPEIEQYQDGDQRDSVSSQTLAVLDHHFPSKRASKSIDFVGFIWNKKQGKPAIFFPKGMDIPVDPVDSVSGRKLLLKVLQKYGSDASPGMAKHETGDHLVYPELELLDDYSRSGLYTTHERHPSVNSRGRIDWPRTIKQMNPALNSQGIPIYLDTVNLSNRIEASTVRRIHAYLVQKSFSDFDWLLPDLKVPPGLFQGPLEMSDRMAIQLLRREIDWQFLEPRIRKLRLMISVLEAEESSAKKGEGRLIGSSRFEGVWEKMCSDYFDNQVQQYKNVATPAYIRGSGSTEEPHHLCMPRSRPRPDIVISKAKQLAVIDAKYYDYNRSPPAWRDLVKQFFYAKAFTHKYPSYSVANVLVMPDTGAAKDIRIQVLDENNSPMDEEFPPIAVHFLKLEEVMACCVKNRRNKEAWNNVWLAATAAGCTNGEARFEVSRQY